MKKNCPKFMGTKSREERRRIASIRRPALAISPRHTERQMVLEITKKWYHKYPLVATDPWQNPQQQRKMRAILPTPCKLLIFQCFLMRSVAFTAISPTRQRLDRLSHITLSETPTIQDENVEAPASVVYYDNVMDESMPDGVVCARGVCVLADSDFNNFSEESKNGLVDSVLNSYLGPRLLLAGASILYGTNFPLGKMMNDALPPSAATCARMVLAALALSPFLPKLSPKLSGSALLCGCFTALGYTTQSLALVDISPATVAFLGAATVIVCPTLEGENAT